jgi:hypothetical protein
MFGVPDKPPAVVAVVAVAALPVHDPELPEQFPVTLPVNGPLNPVEVMVPAFEMGFVFMSNPVVLYWAIMVPLFTMLNTPSDTQANPVS